MRTLTFACAFACTLGMARAQAPAAPVASAVASDAAPTRAAAPASASAPALAPVSVAAPELVPVLELLVLGSGGPGATGRAGASYVVLLDGKARILVDAGPGAFVRLGEAKLNLSELDLVLLTHLHVDHAGGLPGLVKARAVSTGRPITFKVFGPAGHPGTATEASFPSTKRFIDVLFGPNGAFPYLKEFSAPITLDVTDLGFEKSGGKPVQLIANPELVVRAMAGHHRDAPAVMYRVDYKGKSITFSGDIDPAGHANLRRLAHASKLLVFNSVVLDPPGSPSQLYELHTTPQDIGLIAKASLPTRLLLSHLSPVLDKARDAVRASVAQNYSGPIDFAADGMRIVLD